MNDPTHRNHGSDIHFVLEWAWLNTEAPPEIHDRAARALNRPSLAHGFAEKADALQKTLDRKEAQQ